MGNRDLTELEIVTRERDAARAELAEARAQIARIAEEMHASWDRANKVRLATSLPAPVPMSAGDLARVTKEARELHVRIAASTAGMEELP